MAIYHFSAKVIGRAAGRSAVAAAAYRCAGRLYDEALGRTHAFSNKAGVVHSEVMLPDGAPAALENREVLWNAVEAGEARKDAQLAREIELAIPREMTQPQGIALVRDFVAREFVDRGMIADLNVHWDIGRDGELQPHAHVMLTMRTVTEGMEDWQPGDGSPFGPKVREWNATAQLERWREAWAEHANIRMAALGIEERIDHRSYRAQGIELEPQDKIGAPGTRQLERGLPSDRADAHLEIARSNGERIVASPKIGLDTLTYGQATFTVRDMARFAHRHSVGQEQFNAVLGAMRGCDQLVALGRDGHGEERFTSCSMIETELRMARAADQLDTRGHHVDMRHVERAMTSSADRGITLSAEQRDALGHVARNRNLALVIGYAGSGKSAMLGAAREAWEAQGYTVRGAALSGIAAENLTQGSGIDARTIASLEHEWRQGRKQLQPNEIFVIDEASMIGTRQMDRVLSHARDAGAKVVLVGDSQQLQAIEAGAAFRSLAENHGAVEITEVRRQQEDWQRNATRDLANGKTGEALSAYRDHGMVLESATRDAARTALIEGWRSECVNDPAQSRTILSHTRDEVQILNDMARNALKQDGQLGEEIALKTSRGERLIAPGERIIFLRNDRDLGVRNGTLATVERVNPASVDVRLDDGRTLGFDLKDYADIDHGYTTTIHKAQGVTVDRAHVLATPGLDQHASYVALSRHRDSIRLHYGQDDFENDDRLARILGRERPKDMALDYAQAREQFAEHQGYDRSRILDALANERLAETDKAAPAPEQRNPFAGLKLRPSPAQDRRSERQTFHNLQLKRGDGVEQPATSPPTRHPTGLGPMDSPSGRVADSARLERAIQDYAHAHQDIARMIAQKVPALEYQNAALARTADALDAIQPHAAQDLDRAFASEPAVAGEAAKGRTQTALRAMQMESELRANPEMRADQFVATWQLHHKSLKNLSNSENHTAHQAVESSMKALAKSIEKDPAMGAALARRAGELGIGRQQALQWVPGTRTGDIGRELFERKVAASMSRELASSIGRGRDRGLGI
jgi:Ti-type conjugative transfer relaxase TraA